MSLKEIYNHQTVSRYRNRNPWLRTTVLRPSSCWDSLISLVVIDCYRWGLGRPLYLHPSFRRSFSIVSERRHRLDTHLVVQKKYRVNSSPPPFLTDKFVDCPQIDYLLWMKKGLVKKWLFTVVVGNFFLGIKEGKLFGQLTSFLYFCGNLQI